MRIACLFFFLFNACVTFPQEEAILVHHQTFGKGLPLLIINGGPGMSSDGFAPLAKLLAKKHQTIIFDQRGTGQSRIENPNRENITMDLMVEDMELLRRHLGIDNWTVMGHSFGGMLAAYYASKYPSRVNAMILSSSGGLDLGLFARLDIRGRLSAKQNENLTRWSRKIQQGDTTYFAKFQRGLNLAPAYLYDTTFVPVVAARLTQGNLSLNRMVHQDMQRMGFDCKEELRDYHSPVLILQGEQDIIDKETAAKTAEVFPQSTLVFIDKCSHYGWLEQPEKYLGTINDFLSALN